MVISLAISGVFIFLWFIFPRIIHRKRIS
jgi:hypothetical protein